MKLLFHLKAKNLVDFCFPDGYGCVEVHEDHFPTVYDIMIKSGYAWTHHKTEKYFSQYIPGTYLLVQSGSGEYVASCGAKPEGSDAASIQSLAVIPTARDLGIAKALVSHIAKLVFWNGYKELFVETDDFRLPAQKVYTGVGFKPYKK